MSKDHNISIRIAADLSAFTDAMKQFGDACRDAARVFSGQLTPAIRTYIEELKRALRTTGGPWYRRLYWRAAYATADRFPEWVSVD